MRQKTLAVGSGPGLDNGLSRQKTMAAAKQVGLAKQKTFTPSKGNQLRTQKTLMGTPVQKNGIDFGALDSALRNDKKQQSAPNKLTSGLASKERG